MSLRADLIFWIHRYLIEHNAQVGAVNSEGELPLDVATEDAMERLLKGEIKKQGEELLCININTHTQESIVTSCQACFDTSVHDGFV